MKVMVEVDVPELDMIKLRAPVKEAMEKALAEHVAQILTDRAAFFMLSPEDTTALFTKLLENELRKLAVETASHFKFKFLIGPVSPEKKDGEAKTPA